MVSKQLIFDSLGWGLALWLFGYFLGILAFFFVQPVLIGWIVMPVGTGVTLLVLYKFVRSGPLSHYLIVALAWATIAVVCDYLFIVQMLKPADGYYKLDVYLYYALTFVLPLLAGWWRGKTAKAKSVNGRRF